MGGRGKGGVLSDCWLLDMIRGIGDKVRKKIEVYMQVQSVISH